MSLADVEQFKVFKSQIQNLKTEKEIVENEFEKFRENARTKETKKVKAADSKLKELQEQIDSL